MSDKMKTSAKVIGADSDVYNIMAICVRALKADGRKDAAIEMVKRCKDHESYEESLEIMQEYCNFV